MRYAWYLGYSGRVENELGVVDPVSSAPASEREP